MLRASGSWKEGRNILPSETIKMENVLEFNERRFICLLQI